MSRIVAVGWTDSEKLVVVSEDSNVRVFSMHGELLHTFVLAAEAKEQGVLQVKFWGAGIAVLTKRYQFCVVPLIDDPKPCMLANTGLSAAPLSLIHI